MEIFVNITFGAKDNTRQKEIFDAFSMFYWKSPTYDLPESEKRASFEEVMGKLTNGTHPITSFENIDYENLESIEDITERNRNGRSELFYVAGWEGREFAQDMKNLLKLAGASNVRVSFQSEPEE